MWITGVFLTSWILSVFLFVHYVMIVPEGWIEIALSIGTLATLALYPLFYIALVLITMHNPYVFEDVERLYAKAMKKAEGNKDVDTK